MIIKRLLIWLAIPVTGVIVSCGSSGPTSHFEVSGLLRNSTPGKIYLEELGGGNAQGIVVDSFAVAADGRFQLKTEKKESMLYSLRIGQSEFPAAYIINDTNKVAIDITFSKEDNRFAETYEVKGSPSSIAMKEFVMSFQTDLDKLYGVYRQTDSLKKINAPDSVFASLDQQWKAAMDHLREQALAKISTASNPALLLFELGYFQEVNRRYNLKALSLEEVGQIVNKLSADFPDHKGLTAAKKEIAKGLAEQSGEAGGAWVGKKAPDFTLPDVNGNSVSLSSFRGKFVLVDFWASWCGPCRNENPNVVRAYNMFRDKSFTVLGVSLDRPGQKDQWLKAIRQDNLTWTHVSDLKFWESSVVPLYGLSGIPYNVLIDTSGLVIAEGLRGPALQAKLNEVLK